jgi:hypothetical protein
MIVLADFAAAFKTVIGVILSLAGLGMLLMGVIAMSDRSFKSGGVAAGLGAILLVVGLWMVGVMG